MTTLKRLERTILDEKSFKLMVLLFKENPELKHIMDYSRSIRQVKKKIKEWAFDKLKNNKNAYLFYSNKISGKEAFKKLEFKDYASIRIIDYIDHSSRQFEDPCSAGNIVENDPFKILFHAAKQGTSGAKPAFFYDMIHLFRQFMGKEKPTPVSKKKICEWMDRHGSGLDEKIIKIRKKNKLRILNIIIEKISKNKSKNQRFCFNKQLSSKDKLKQARIWWDDFKFHIKFGARTPYELNEYLDFSLNRETMDILNKAVEKGMPIFANPYYLSLLDTRTNPENLGADLAIRQYIIYSKELVEQFGSIQAWEKEDIIEEKKPNAAGWIIPDSCFHRRYPDVAILIPRTSGRSCGGLCATCQRMYGFQNGKLDFNFDKLKPSSSWKNHLKHLIFYFETDSQLRDIIITGGDALMSSDSSLKKILNSIYTMAKRKIDANKMRKDGEKYAQMTRVRLGTRLPVYLPMRIKPELIKILADFKKAASKIGIKQFVFQTHFESAMEITPESRECINQINKAGWIVTNQHVFTSAASRRGHNAKLRKIMTEIGIFPYYTFTVKGHMENYSLFTPNARLVQEMIEEKKTGLLQKKFHKRIKELPQDAEHIVQNLNQLKKAAKLPFLSTDRNVLNLPGVGKSLTFRTIGITHDGRRILEFDHDFTRKHSPIVEKIGKMAIVESKSLYHYLNQLDEMGEDIPEYYSTYGYSISETEPRMPVYEYPEFDYKLTDKITNYKP